MTFAGLRVTIMGLGHFGGGVAAARWLARQGALVTVSDTADQVALAAALQALADVPITQFHLGGHREEDFREVDLVVVNPAVRPDNPWLQIARQSGARLAGEIELFIDACPARLVGVTGSNGKSTTAAMTAAILKAAGCRAWLGGNLGGSLLECLPQMRPDDWCVLELSSFQLWHMRPDATAPQIAIVTNCTPNHLDWHGTWEHYTAAKQRLLVGQAPADYAVLNAHDPEAVSWSHLVRGQLTAPLPLADLPSLATAGEHNRINAACAAAAAVAAGCDAEAIRRGLESFHGLPQRLEWFAVIGGRRFYNDSTATTPESTIAAINSLDQPVWLLAGGRDKGFDFADMIAAIVRRARGAAFFGTVGETLRNMTAARSSQFDCIATATLADALAWCWERSRHGETILLSPGCASTDQFRNFQERGRAFVELVGRVAGASGSS